MKKVILLFMLISLSGLFAELEIEIPFDTHIIGDDFSLTGAYEYESEWMTVTNIGSTTENYTLTWTFDSLPANWTVSICNPQFCLSPNWPVPITLAPGAFEELHIAIHVASAGGFDFDITLEGGDLTEPIVLDFRFDTADNVSADDELLTIPKLSQNYPNPFNPSTTISLNLTPSELTQAELKIFNSKGQLVKVFNQVSENVIWNGENQAGKSVNSGIYFYQLRIGDQSITKKMVLLK